MPWANDADACAALIELPQIYHCGWDCLWLFSLHVSDACLLFCLQLIVRPRVSVASTLHLPWPKFNCWWWFLWAHCCQQIHQAFPIHSSISHSFTGTLTGLKWPHKAAWHIRWLAVMAWNLKVSCFLTLHGIFCMHTHVQRHKFICTSIAAW